MTQTPPIELLKEIADQEGFYSAIFLTYGADLGFFEQAILRTLWTNGCRNIVVAMDGERYTDTVADMRGTTDWVGRRYVVLPIHLGYFKSFHPKMVLLSGEARGRLLVGSGNLTFTGYGHNHEVYSCLDWSLAQPALHPIFASAWRMIKQINDRWGYSDQANEMLRKTEYVASWLSQSQEPAEDTWLLHTVGIPLIDQISEILAGERIERITAVTPFLDNAATALEELYKRFAPTEVRLVLQDSKVVGEPGHIEGLRQAGMPLSYYCFGSNDRYVHAKIYLFETSASAYLLTGSPNLTRAAWLANSENGNVETALLRRNSNCNHYDNFIWETIPVLPQQSLATITFQAKQSQLSPSTNRAGELLDVVIEGELISIHYRWLAPLRQGLQLQLRLSTTPPTYQSLGEADMTEARVHVDLPPGLASLLDRPCSASLWGKQSLNSQLVDLGSNELWITNISALRREMRSGSPETIRVAGTLSDMFVGSDEEWKDLFDCVAKLAVLDVNRIQRVRPRGMDQKQAPQAGRDQNVKTERETDVRLIDGDPVDSEAEDNQLENLSSEVARESPFYALFEYVRSGLPGFLHENTGEKPRDVPNRKGHKGHRWTPSERNRRLFLGLISRYSATLSNSDYMRSAPILSIVQYYSIFQRLVWLLFEHEAIDLDQCLRLICDINAGFFGKPDTDPPALSVTRQQYLRPKWRDQWNESDIAINALASITIAQLWVGLVNDETKSLVADQAVPVICGIVTTLGLSTPIETAGDAVERAAEMYGETGVLLVSKIDELLEAEKPTMAKLLQDWISRVTAALTTIEDPSERRRLREARLDYGHSCFDILEKLGEVEAQVALASDIIDWYRLLGHVDRADKWSLKRNALLEENGKNRQYAQALFEHGRNLFFDRLYGQARHELEQALGLAHLIQDNELATSCRTYIRNCEIFLRM